MAQLRCIHCWPSFCPTNNFVGEDFGHKKSKNKHRGGGGCDSAAGQRICISRTLNYNWVLRIFFPAFQILLLASVACTADTKFTDPNVLLSWVVHQLHSVYILQSIKLPFPFVYRPWVFCSFLTLLQHNSWLICFFPPGKKKEKKIILVPYWFHHFLYVTLDT